MENVGLLLREVHCCTIFEILFIWNDVGYLVLLDFTSMLIQTVGLLSKLVASLMSNYFLKRPSGAPLTLCQKLYDVCVGFVTPPPPTHRPI